MPGERNQTYRAATLNMAEGTLRRFWLAVLAISTFWFAYYFFAEVWPALLGAGSG
jgi:hypothetical protein